MAKLALGGCDQHDTVPRANADCLGSAIDGAPAPDYDENAGIEVSAAPRESQQAQ